MKKLMISGVVFLVSAVVALLIVFRGAPEKPAARVYSTLEKEALKRFEGVEPKVTLPDGRQIPPSNEEHALQMKVNAYKVILAREAAERDPTFHLKAEAELKRRKPMHASIEWDDLSGNRQMDFTVDDSSTCPLDGKEQVEIEAKDIAKWPCLGQTQSTWDEGTKLRVILEPVGAEEPLWNELLHATRKQLAAEAHLAQLPVVGEGT